MKRFCILLMAAALFAACENEIDFNPSWAGDELIMNSLLDASQTQHSVYVGVSHLGSVGAAKNASVACYINGTQVPVVHADSTAKASRYHQSAFVFDASLKEGDEIRLEATADGFHASSTVTVPCPAKILSADTLSVLEPAGNNDYYPFMTFRVKVADVSPDSDFFSLDIYSDCDYIARDTTGTVVEVGNDRRACNVNTSDDLILSEDNIVSAQGGFDDLFDVGTPNRYGAFQDIEFAGGSVELKPKIYSYDCDHYVHPSVGGSGTVEMSPALVVKVSHISQRHYYYLKALNSLLAGDSDLELEDVSIPDNVDGGIGFVGVANPAYCVFSLPKKVMPYTDLYYDDPGWPYYE